MANGKERMREQYFFLKPGHKNAAVKLAAVGGVLVLLFSTGCAPYTELKNLSIVEGVGLDNTGNGFNLSCQLFNPKGAGGGGGGQGGKSSGQSQNLFISAEGSTVYDASRNTSLQVGKKLYYANTSIFVLGENVCQSKFVELVDFFERSPEIRPNVRVVVAKGSAAGVLSAQKNGELLSVDNLKSMMDNNAISSKILNYNVLDIFEKESTDISDIALPAIKLTQTGDGQENIVSDGSAVFSANKLAGYLDNAQTRGVMWVDGSVQNGIIAVDLPQQGKASLQVMSEKSKIDAGFKNGRPYVTVNIDVSTKMVDYESKGDFAINEKCYTELAALQSVVVKNETESAINTSLKNYKADVFGFGMALRRSNPQEWKKTAEKWREEIPNLATQVNVKSTVKMITSTANRQG